MIELFLLDFLGLFLDRCLILLYKSPLKILLKTFLKNKSHEDVFHIRLIELGLYTTYTNHIFFQ